MPMSLKKNILANYVSQIYVTAVGILILPLYIKFMGAEVYGLVGFYAMLQAWFGLLDIGLTPTIGRETARYHGGATSALIYRQLFRALSLIFFITALVGGGSLFLLAEAIATKWLNVESLKLSDVAMAVQIMAISVALRWMCGLYRGVVTGSEQLVWLSGFNVLIATLRFIAVLPVMWLFGFTPFVFFIHQLCIAFFELIGLCAKSHKLLPSNTILEQPIGWSFQPVKPLVKFAISIAFTTSVWLLVTQTDKLVLSGILPLDEYGHFTIAVLIASGIMTLTAPISSAIIPRLVRLYAETNHENLIELYRRATQLVCIIAGSAAITITLSSEKLLFAWMGDIELAQSISPILQLYSAGYGILTVAAFPSYLQYARGDLRYHLIGNLVLVLFLLPGIVFSAKYYGAFGAGCVWFAMNAAYLFIWVSYTHHKLEPGLNIQWITQDVFKILLPTLGIGILFNVYGFDANSRIECLLFVLLQGGIAISTSLAMSTIFRDIITLKLKNSCFSSRL